MSWWARPRWSGPGQRSGPVRRSASPHRRRTPPPAAPEPRPTPGRTDRAGGTPGSKPSPGRGNARPRLGRPPRTRPARDPGRDPDVPLHRRAAGGGQVRGQNLPTRREQAGRHRLVSRTRRWTWVARWPRRLPGTRSRGSGTLGALRVPRQGPPALPQRGVPHNSRAARTARMRPKTLCQPPTAAESRNKFLEGEIAGVSPEFRSWWAGVATGEDGSQGPPAAPLRPLQLVCGHPNPRMVRVEPLRRRHRAQLRPRRPAQQTSRQTAGDRLVDLHRTHPLLRAQPGQLIPPVAHAAAMPTPSPCHGSVNRYGRHHPAGDATHVRTDHAPWRAARPRLRGIRMT